MNFGFKILLIMTVIICVVAQIWFVLGNTANFQRSLDLIATYRFVYLLIPSILVTAFSIRALVKDRNKSDCAYYMLLSCVVLLAYFSFFLFKGVNKEGWLTEKVLSDSLRITADKKFEYRLDLINLFQKNSHANLHIRNLTTGEEKNIKVDLCTSKIVTIGSGDDTVWAVMEPSNVPERYILYTTKKLRIPYEKFEVDTLKGTLVRLE